jgi:hypothetical protein
MNYTLCATNGIELVTGKRGQIFVTLRGYIKLSGKPKQTISERTTRGFLAGKILETTALTVPGRGNRLCKLIPIGLALEWLAKDNPELAEAIDGDLVGFLQSGVDLSQFHKSKTASPITEIPVMEPEIMPATEPVATAVGDLTVLDFGGKNIRFERRGDRMWVNLTDMAKATGKLIGHWTRLDGTTQFLTELESIIQIRIMVSNVGGTPEMTGTWAIEEVAIDFAAWCNTSFRIWVAQQIRTLMTEGTVAIAKPEPAPTPAPTPQLTSADRLRIATEADKLLAKYGMDTNPRFKQAAQDFMGDILGLTQNTLPAPDTQKWYGVAERAEQLGYPVALVLKHRSQLGRFVAQHVGGSRKEDRLCNGTQRPINLYPASPELDAAIATYLKNFY